MFNSKRMHELREAKGLSMAELAQKVGCSVPFISYLENGQKEPNARTLFHLSKALGCSMDELYTKE